MNYTELVKALRCQFFGDQECGDDCPYCGDGCMPGTCASDAADAIEELQSENESLAKSVNDADEILRNRAAADVREVKRGVWCPQPSEFEDATVFVCSNCGHMILVSNEREELPFCGNCGADMREEQT